MKKLILLLISVLTTLGYFSQNNAPIAVNDTIEVTYNDSIILLQVSNGTPGLPFMNNDSDPDGNLVYIAGGFYSGLGSYEDTLISSLPNFFIWKVGYKPQLNYVGIDSLIYVIKDNGVPVMYDTATIYLFVKHQEYQQLNLNNINARIETHGLFFNTNSGAAFEAPKGGGSSTIYEANLWLAGKNQDSIYSNTGTYNTEFTYGHLGPIMDSSQYKPYYDFDWDRLWKVTSNEINTHINNWNNAGYQVPQVFLDWPAHGDTAKGQTFYLAPFIDNNGDGVYNPYDGDYPKIKGQQAIYFIYNDIREQIDVSPMQTEIHGMLYAYNCPSDSAINNAIFLDYTIYNRSSLTYDSTYFGAWTAFNIGNRNDDYIGCDVNRSSFYGYNGDGFDESANGVQGYQSYPPAQSVTFLQGAKQDNDGIDNNVGIAPNETINGVGFGDGILDNEHWGMEHFAYYSIGGGQFVGDGTPSNALDYYNYMYGRWRDGSQMVWGGNGNAASSGGTIPTKYLFPGASDPLWYGTGGVTATPTNWSEFSVLNPPGNRRGIGSTGPFTFEPDSSITITLAYVFGRDYQTTGNQAGVVVMQERIDSIRSYYLTDFVTVCGGTLNVAENNKKENSLLVYPNPFNSEITINYTLENSSATLTIYNLIGKQIMSQTITQNTTVIDLADQANGIYFVTITDKNNRLSKKIIKN
ncbi:MAG: hypothetical protein COA97_03055 [Flavobacteriales bacterium]|nr:MAG: hypothetical protein COA97_03055 [Flavobacteriales bacterium]